MKQGTGVQASLQALQGALQQLTLAQNELVRANPAFEFSLAFESLGKLQRDVNKVIGQVSNMAGKAL